MLLTNCLVTDPSSPQPTHALRLREGIVVERGDRLAPLAGETVYDCRGLTLLPGLVDIHVHFRTPGQPHKETFWSGMRAALAGGYTRVVQMPNTIPVLDSPELIRQQTTALPVRCHVAAAVTEGSRQERVVDMARLARAGAVAFTDDGRPVRWEHNIRAALQQSAELGIPVMEHAEVLELSDGRPIHGGVVAEQLGILGQPSAAEYQMVLRDAELAAETGGHIHICHLSTWESVEILRESQARGHKVTGEVTPHHLFLTEDAVLQWGTGAKMAPPLRSERDRRALLAGLLDGTIACVATDHAPHTGDEKSRPLADAPFGVIGLETAFALLYTYCVQAGLMDLTELVNVMSKKPAALVGLPGGSLQPGDPADLTLVDLDAEWVVDADDFESKSRNCPFIGWKLRGRIEQTMVAGEWRWRR
ncbi:MAG: dihydroorotase [bacterium]